MDGWMHTVSLAACFLCVIAKPNKDLGVIVHQERIRRRSRQKTEAYEQRGNSEKQDDRRCVYIAREARV